MSGKKTKLHRGHILNSAVQRSGLSKQEAARRAGYSRSAFYKHIQDRNLPSHILISYGTALPYDFTDEIPDMPKYSIYSIEHTNRRPTTLEEAHKMIDDLTARYYALLEKYNRLVEEKLESKH